MLPAPNSWSVVIHGVQERVDHIGYGRKVPQQLLEAMIQHLKQRPVKVIPRKSFRMIMIPERYKILTFFIHSLGIYRVFLETNEKYQLIVLT